MGQALEVTFKDDSPEVERFGEIFDVEGEELAKRMGALAAASFEEYQVEMSGLRSISTMREKREFRLYLLYKHLGKHGGITDAQVGELFQLTRRQVATLINGTWARFRPEMEKEMLGDVKAALEQGKWNKENNVLTVQLPDSMATYLKDVLAETTAPPVETVADVQRTYKITLQSVEALCEELEIPTKEIVPGKTDEK